MTAPVTVTTPTDTQIVMTRAFAAPRNLVFAAWTRPELITRWYGARGWTIVDCAIVLTVGGRWRLVWRGPGGATMAAGGVYRAITPPDRLTYSEEFDDHWYPGSSVVEHDFAGENGGTTLTTTILFPSREVRDAVLASPMERGGSEGYERLDAMLSELEFEGEPS